MNDFHRGGTATASTHARSRLVVAITGASAGVGRATALAFAALVLVGSALVYRGIPLQSAYCAAKHAVQGFLESLRCQLLHDRSRVRVTMVQLPARDTPQFGWMKSRLPNQPQPVPPIYDPRL